MNLLEGLNDSQYKAVTHTEGPVMVMAGAGSGKTKVLTTRIAYIIKELGINPYSILAVTFTNKAAKEMKDRLEKMLDMKTTFMWVSTFHSFCVRLLRDEVNNLNDYKKGFTIIDDDDQLKIVKEILKATEIEGKPKEILKRMSKEKNGMTLTLHNPTDRQNLNIVKDRYQKYLVENNLMDFDDLIINTINLLKTNADIRYKYQDKFNYILVDEFQDTNSLQYELMKILALKSRNLFVVGDDFQSIYSFRGAKIENINKMRSDFEHTELILLERNYRSTTEILNLANDVIKHNPNQIKKVMKSNDVAGEKPIFYEGYTSYDEVSFVVDTIKKLVSGGDKYSDFAVLYRANYLSREFEDVFIRNKIPYRIYGGVSFFQRMEIKDVISYLRLLINHNDNYSFKRVAKLYPKVGDGVINKLIEQSTSESLYDSIDNFKSSGVAADNIRSLKKNLDSIYAQIENVRLFDLVDFIMKDCGYMDLLNAYCQDKEEFQERLENVNEFKSVLAESEDFYDFENPVEKLDAILQDLALRTDAKEYQDDDNVVRLSTYHQAKGLEFKTVFMVAMEENIFPSVNSILDTEIEEERRICYVGVTRAKRHLYLTCCGNRLRFGYQENNPRSRFVREMDKSLYTNYNEEYKKPKMPQNGLKKPISSIKPKVEAQAQASVLIKPGDKINHKVFGDGVVVSLTGEIATIAFKAEVGIKKLKANHPAIRKL